MKTHFKTYERIINKVKTFTKRQYNIADDDDDDDDNDDGDADFEENGCSGDDDNDDVADVDDDCGDGGNCMVIIDVLFLHGKLPSLRQCHHLPNA